VVSGLLIIPFMGGLAVAPTLAALVWRSAGYDAVIALALLASLFGLVCLILAWRSGTTPRRSG